jgi:hypothetical protein
MYKITQLSNGGEFYEYTNGSKFWHLNGKYHREDGHAIELANGDKYWYLNGNRHREDGPAIDYISGDKEWWLNGQLISCTTQKQFLRLIKLKGFW